MKSALEENVVRCLREWIKWEGKMESLRADGAHNISGKLVEKFCKDNKIVLTKVSPITHKLMELRKEPFGQ